MTSERQSAEQRQTGQSPRTAAEWLSLGVALLVLAGVIGTVVALWQSPQQAPPHFTLERGEVRRDGGWFYLPVTVQNTGDLTASAVTLEGTLSGDGRDETASTTFDFIPGRSTVEGVLVFTTEPTTVTVLVRSFQKP